MISGYVNPFLEAQYDNSNVSDEMSVSIGKALEACWMRELRLAYLHLAKRFLKRMILVFLLFIGAMFVFYGVATAVETSLSASAPSEKFFHLNTEEHFFAEGRKPPEGQYSIAPSSSTDSTVSCDKSTGCRYLV